MYELALFAGAGGGILGGKLCGFTCVGAVEIEKYPREVLKQRQRDGILPRFPIWDDVTTFRIDNPECREYIEKLKEAREQLIVTGGFPCQDISAAGKGAGIKQNTRSGLWFEMARIIDEIRPSRVLVENSPVLTSRGLGIVLGDLAQMGYNAKWGVLGAVDVGAPHKRERIWIVANSNSSGRKRKNLSQSKERDKKTQSSRSSEDVANSSSKRQQRPRVHGGSFDSKKDKNRQANRIINSSERKSGPWLIEPGVGRVANGVADRVDRLKAIGNGQVPAVVKAAWEILNN
ncbi:MAG: DNA (cytosine-5-)-methyltransferase [Psychroserpens sp.]|nr:DNA (cytosine-5-)-methyltransferase [Psychroserpens sp.]